MQSSPSKNRVSLLANRFLFQINSFLSTIRNVKPFHITFNLSGNSHHDKKAKVGRQLGVLGVTFTLVIHDWKLD